MDPLSITVSVLSLAVAAHTTCEALGKLRSIFKTLPGRLHALNNEVADLEIVLNELATLIKERQAVPVLENPKGHDQIPAIVNHTQNLLSDLRRIVEQISVAGGCSKIAPVQKIRAWQRHITQLNLLQDEIRTAKSSLNLIIGTSSL